MKWAGTARRIAWAPGTMAVLLLIGGLVLSVMNHSTMDFDTVSLYIVLALSGLCFTTVGSLIARQQPANAIAWLFCLMGVALAAVPFAQEYAIQGRYLSPGSLPAADWFGYASDWLFLVVLGPLALVFLIFPSGRVLSPRWRWVLWIAGLSGALMAVGQILAPDVATGTGGDRLMRHGGPVKNPLHISSLKLFAGPGSVGNTAGLVLFVASLAAVVSLVIRFRRAEGVERQQIRWLAYTGATAVLLLPILPLALALNNNHILGNLFWYGITSVLALGIPIASGIAILKYRLYNLDVVVKKTVVFGVLAGFATLVYLAVVVGIGAAIGDRGNSALTLAAAAIVAMAFQPLRSAARRFADRLVYGQRATPYEVLSEFSDRMSVGYSIDEVLPRMAEILGQGTGARRASVWLRIGTEARLAASWPDEATQPAHIGIPVEELEHLPDVERTFPVSHSGELLGALGVTMPPAEPLTPAQIRLVGDLASQGGLILRNVRLIEELRASRQRLVSAQDEERRRIERNIHDGAQQQLVALAVKLNLVRRIARQDPDRADSMLMELQSEAQRALEDLRDLARGIFPPLLAEKGLAAALQAQAARSAVPITVDGDGVGRYPQDVEAAVYFCSLEALQNVAKYADASRAFLRLSQTDGVLRFQVVDDGRGFDPASTDYGTGLQGMVDRMEALGGAVTVRSSVGAGTTVSGEVPVPSRTDRASGEPLTTASRGK